MQSNQFVRNSPRVHKALKVLPNGSLVCIEPVKIYVPSRFTEQGLAELGSQTYISGLYAMVVDKVQFASSTVNAMIEITPSSIGTITIDGDEYLEFSFDAGSVVMPNLKPVKNKTFVYNIYSELFAKGRVPWYLGYLQMGRIFDTAKKHAGADVGDSHEITELLNSIVARDATNRHHFYRSSVKTLNDLNTSPPAYISMRSIQYAMSTTLDRIGGSYFSEGVVSALVNPSEKEGRMSEILRR